MKGFILSAGLGTRLRPLTYEVPKPGVEFCNIPLVKWAEALLKPLPIEELVFNLHHKPEVLKAVIEKTFSNSRPTLSYSLEVPNILGSGGAYWGARQYFQSEDFLISVNGDNVLIPEKADLLKNLVDFHQQTQSLATLLGTPDARAGKEFNALWVNEKNQLLSVAKEGAGRPLHFTGVMVLSKKLFSYLPEGVSNIFQEALLPALQQGETISVMEAPVTWYETGDYQNFLFATEDFQKKLSSDLAQNEFVKSLYKSFLNLDHTQLFKKSGSANVFSLSEIPRDTKLEGTVVLGSHVQVGADCQISESTILSGSHLDNHSRYKQTIFKN